MQCKQEKAASVRVKGVRVMDAGGEVRKADALRVMRRSTRARQLDLHCTQTDKHTTQHQHCLKSLKIKLFPSLLQVLINNRVKDELDNLPSCAHPLARLYN